MEKIESIKTVKKETYLWFLSKHTYEKNYNIKKKKYIYIYI